MGRLFGLILSLLGGIAFGLGAFSLLTAPEAGWISAQGAEAVGTAILPGLALWFAAWIAFALDALQRDLDALRQETAVVGNTLNRFVKQVEAAQTRPNPNATRRS